jgi:hypothetical protein
MFEIIHRVDGRSQAVVVAANSEEQAQDVFIAHFEARGLVHGEILNIEEV